MLDEVVSEEEALPVLETTLDHMDVMRSPSVLIPFDESGVEGRRVIPEAWTPEVVVSLGLKHRYHPHLGFVERRHLNQHVHNGFCRQVWDRRTPEMLDSPDDITGEARAQVLGLLPKQSRPARVIGYDGNDLPRHAVDLLLQCFHSYWTPRAQGFSELIPRGSGFLSKQMRP